MQNRDDFSDPTKRQLERRASGRCSFPGCKQATSGPSDEAPHATTNIGIAAHICAAAPGGRRYSSDMTPAQRSHIDNAIWLCSNHAALIDRDEQTYTVELLRKMKMDYEAACQDEVRGTSLRLGEQDLIGIGPDVVVLGALKEIGSSEWTVKAAHFIVGDLKVLADFIAAFDRLPVDDLYVVVNVLGDGRVLKGPPTVTTIGADLEIRCPVSAKAERKSAHELGSQLAISDETGDVFVRNRSIARVSGFASLPQSLRQGLSLQRGESPFHPRFGTRLGEYFSAYKTSPWFNQLVKLEVIRQSAIPYHDPLSKASHTPLRAVERVWAVTLLEEAMLDKRTRIHFDFDIKGVGRWECELAILVATTKGPNVLASLVQMAGARQGV